jgi:hypothetical protein
VPPTATLVPSATATTKPTDTPPPTATTPPTATAVPPTATTPPTATSVPPTATKVKATKPAATRAPATQAPATQAAEPTNAPATGGGKLYSWSTGGPQGYTSILVCNQSDGSPCQSVMAPGDKAFSIRLVAGDDAVPAIFVPFGLAVEKDGVNQADAYMTVDAGWLEPGTYAIMGTSRSFSAPGHYVIRTNGCYVTRETYPNCTWGTVDGTIVIFDIQ